MPIPTEEKNHAEKVLQRVCLAHSPEDLRDKLVYEPRVVGNAAFIVERRPHFMRRTEWTEHLVAKFRYIVSAGTWELYWADRNGKWHVYEGVRANRRIEPLIAEVWRDRTNIFFG
jgi:hypothetical protein